MTGRPKKEVDATLVERLAMIQCTTKEIAAVCGCSVDTLDRRFADLIEKGKLSGKSSLRKKQYEVAMNGNVSMLIFLGKQMLDQKDEQRIHNSTTLHDSIMSLLKNDK